MAKPKLFTTVEGKQETLVSGTNIKTINNTSILGAGNIVTGLEPTVVTGTLSAGDTSITLSSSAITTSSILDVYTDTYGVAPKTMVASTGSVTMTFKAQSSDLGIRLEVR